jgi:peptide/nickel transport system substrate-binding protein
MPSSSKNTSEQSVNRRRVLQTLGIASAAALAGCSGSSNSDGGSTGDLGERVPTLTFQYWSDQGPPTVLFEETISNIQTSIGKIGIQIETMPMTTAGGLTAVANDTREFHVGVNSHGPSPGRLDPHDLLTTYSIRFAGANGKYNPANYANCEYSELAWAQATIGDSKKRHQTVYDAMSIFSADMPFIPTIERPFTAAVNTNRLTKIEAGPAGLSEIHWVSLLQSNPRGKNGTDSIITNLPAEMLTSSFYPTVADGDALVLYTNLTTSPLCMYNANYELFPVLAESWETNEDSTATTFKLRDATFHNGAPVTPEDIKWTYEFLRDMYHDGVYSWTFLPKSLSVEVVDDKTVTFHTDEPAPQLVTAKLAIYGVLPKEPYLEAGIEENPTNFKDPMIGAGPYQMISYTNQQSLSLEPHDGHPLWSPNLPIAARLYGSVNAARRAFESGALNLGLSLDPSAGAQIESSMGDSAQIIHGAAHLPFGVMPQTSFAPGNMLAFRQALSHMIDRQGLNETYALGNSSIMTHCTFNSKFHPWYNKKALTKIAGKNANVDKARQILKNAGWGWDDNGNLHYPKDADMAAWPKGETPSSKNFPCLKN